MKVSIITAAYNREKVIERAIKSVKQQSYTDIESVFIDGASRDDTFVLGDAMLSDNDISISQADGGIYDALNKGIQHSTGDIIGFLHSDDVYENIDVISNVVDVFVKESCDIVYGDACFFKQANEAISIRHYRSAELSRRNLAWGKMPAHTAMFIKRDVYQRCGLFNPSYKIAGDYEFLCRMLVQLDVKAVYIKKILVRMQLGGLSTGGLRSTLQLNREALRSCRDNGLKTNLFMILSKYPSKIIQFLR